MVQLEWFSSCVATYKSANFEVAAILSFPFVLGLAYHSLLGRRFACSHNHILTRHILRVT
jgi:hypothetical protein